MGLPNQAGGKQHRQTSHTFFTGWALVVGPPPQCSLVLRERKGLTLEQNSLTLLCRAFGKESDLDKTCRSKNGYELVHLKRVTTSVQAQLYILQHTKGLI